MRSLQIFGEFIGAAVCLAFFVSLLIVAGRPGPKRIGTTDDPMYSKEERDKWEE